MSEHRGVLQLWQKGDNTKYIANQVGTKKNS